MRLRNESEEESSISIKNILDLRRFDFNHSCCHPISDFKTGQLTIDALVDEAKAVSEAIQNSFSEKINPGIDDEISLSEKNISRKEIP